MEGGMIYVAEVDGRAVAGIDAEDLDQARDFLLPAVQEMTREMFARDMNYRFDETASVTTRHASADEVAAWERSRERKTSTRSPVVWFFPVPRIDHG
jgi:hypothetical protein